MGIYKNPPPKRLRPSVRPKGQRSKAKVDCRTCKGSGVAPPVCPHHLLPFSKCGCTFRPTHPSAKDPCPDCKGTGKRPLSLTEQAEEIRFLFNDIKVIHRYIIRKEYDIAQAYAKKVIEKEL